MKIQNLDKVNRLQKKLAELSWFVKGALDVDARKNNSGLEYGLTVTCTVFEHSYPPEFNFNWQIDERSRASMIAAASAELIEIQNELVALGVKL